MTGPRFTLTPEALRDAELKLGDAAAEVRSQFGKLVATVEGQRSYGAAFSASRQVALDLQAQAKRFNDLVNAFAEQINAAKLKYVSNAQSGTQAFTSITGGEAPAGRSYDRLTGR